MNERPLTTFEIADYCKVTHRTVQQWIITGKLKAYRTPGNHSRVQAHDFADFLKKYQMPVPDEFVYAQGKKRILIVDDDKTMVQLITKFLKPNSKYEIQSAFDGFMAGKKFAEFKPDLITLDIMMPYLNGDEVLREIRTNSKNAKVKIIVISGVNEMEKINKIKDLGVDEFIVKPFDRKVVVQAVERLLGVTV